MSSIESGKSPSESVKVPSPVKQNIVCIVGYDHLDEQCHDLPTCPLSLFDAQRAGSATTYAIKI